MPRTRSRSETLQAVIAIAVRRDEAFSTTDDLANTAGCCARTLQRDANSAGTSAKAIRDLIQCIRAFLEADRHGVAITEAFSELDPRTAHQLLKRAEIRRDMTLVQFLERQRLVPAHLLFELREQLTLQSQGS